MSRQVIDFPHRSETRWNHGAVGQVQCIKFYDRLDFCNDLLALLWLVACCLCVWGARACVRENVRVLCLLLFGNTIVEYWINHISGSFAKQQKFPSNYAFYVTNYL